MAEREFESCLEDRGELLNRVRTLLGDALNRYPGNAADPSLVEALHLVNALRTRRLRITIMEENLMQTRAALASLARQVQQIKENVECLCMKDQEPGSTGPSQASA